MGASLDYKEERGLRMLDIYDRLNRGELLTKRDLARYYHVGEKTIQRDIDAIRNYLSENQTARPGATVLYDRRAHGYRLSRFEREWLTNQEALALCKILLESRALSGSEMKQLMEKILTQASPGDREILGKIIRGEAAMYVPLQHGKSLLGVLWKLSLAINEQKEVGFFYTRKDGTVHWREVKPLSILFSEFYFYMIARYSAESGEVYRTYRIDRMTDFKMSGHSFCVPYRDKFHEGEFRKRIQFMFNGKLQRIRFRFFGSSIEHVLDRLPTAKAKEVSKGVYEISAEVYGDGVLIWLLSQGSQVQVLAPDKLRKNWSDEIQKMEAARYRTE